MKTKILFLFIVLLIGINDTTFATIIASPTGITTNYLNINEKSKGNDFWDIETMSEMMQIVTDTTCETATEVIPGNTCNPITYAFNGSKKFFKFTATTSYINIVVSNVSTTPSEINNLLLTSLPCYPQQPIITQTNNPLQITVSNLIVGNTYLLRLRKLSTYTTYFSICFKNVAGTSVTANAGNDVSICEGSGTQLNATGGTSYLWSPATGLSNTNISNPIASPSVTTTYTVTVSNNGASATDNVVITVNPLPYANAGSDQIINIGESVQLGSNPVSGYSYLWSPITGLSNPNIANPLASPTSNTIYNLTVKNTITGCKNTDLVSVNMNVPAQPGASCETAIEIIPGSNCIPDTFSFSGNYLWFKFTANTSFIDILVSNVDIIGSGINALFIGAYNCNSPVPFAQATNPLQLSLNISENTTYLIAVYKQTTDSIPSNFSICLKNTPNLQIVADAGSDISICSGSSTQLNASGGTSYLWSPASGLSNINISNPIASPLVSTTYTVTVTKNGVSATDNMTVTVKPLPIVDAGNNVTINLGDSVQIGNYPSSPSYTYFWTPIPLVNNNTLHHPYAKPNITTTYYLKVTDPATGCYNTDSVKVIVTMPPGTSCENAIEITPKNICKPDTFISAVPKMFYKFTASSPYINIIVSNIGNSSSGINKLVLTSLPCYPQQPIIAQVTNPLQLTLNNLIIGKTYLLVLVKDAPISSQFSIIFKDSPPTANAGNDITICEESSTQLNASGGTTYQWSPADNLSNPNIANPIASPQVTTTYQVIASDYCGSAQNDVVVTVAVPIAEAGNNQTVCEGTDVILIAKGGITYQWDNGVSNGLPFVSTVTTTYTVAVTDENGCTATDEVTINVNPLPLAEAGNNQAVCAGGSVTLTATGGTSYQWDNGVINGVPFVPEITNIYTVTVTDVYGCSAIDNVTITVNPLPVAEAGSNQTVCAGGSVLLTATGGTSYQWDNGVINEISFVPAVTNIYTVTVTNDFSCTAIDNVTITVNPLPIAEAGNNQAVCAGGSVTLTATGGTSYQWDNGVINGVPFVPEITNIYTVTVTNNYGCSAIDNATITVNPLPVAEAGDNQAVCAGGSVTLNASGGDFYQWNNSIINGVSFIPSVTTTYTVTVTNNNGCFATDDITITVNPLLAAEAGNDQVVCEGGSVTLTANGGTSYQWDNGVINGVSFVPTNTTTYTVTVTDDNGCYATGEVVVVVNPETVVTLTSAVGTNNQTLCVNTLLTNITYNTTGATSATFTGLPSGVNGSWVPNAITIFGSPTSIGTFNYTITLIGVCDTITTTGTINVTANSTITLTSGVGSDVQNVYVNKEISHIKYTITDAIAVNIIGLPPGVTGSLTATGTGDKFMIKGKPTVTGTFNYTLIVTGSCGILTATGTITSSNKIDKKMLIYSQDESDQELPIKVYPNPAKDKMNIKVTLKTGTTGAVHIYDANGNEVMALPLTEGDNSLKVNLTNVASGLYYCKFYVGKKMVKSEKLIIFK